MAKYEIQKIEKSDERYPKLLSQISDPPSVLYCRGNLNLLNKTSFAVVGTRKLTSYGREACEKITTDLAMAGFTIVSGLALGIDSIAHRAALDAKGKTIAVLGSGVGDETIYPKTNYPLARDILNKEGLIISEYEPGTHATEFTFPKRNRIISGLCHGTLVVEADEKSGSLITARQALDQNRDVFAVPGSIFSRQSLGANALIRRGAKAVSSAQNILEEYEHQPELKLNFFNQDEKDISTQDPARRKILDILKNSGDASVDELITKSEFEASEVLSALTMLEMKGLVVEKTRGCYRLIN